MTHQNDRLDKNEALLTGFFDAAVCLLPPKWVLFIFDVAYDFTDHKLIYMIIFIIPI